MTQFQIYVLLEYSAIITIVVGLFRWKRISSFLRWQVLALGIMLLGDFIANSIDINLFVDSRFEINISLENNLPVYIITYPLSLAAIVYSWVNVPEYDVSVKRRIYLFSIIPIITVIVWSIFQSWLTAPFFFQDYALIHLLYSAVLLALSLQFFHIFLNTEVFEPELKNSLFIVACAHLVFAVPSTFIIIFSELYSSNVAFDIWVGREIAYCISNIIIVLAFFVKK